MPGPQVLFLLNTAWMPSIWQLIAKAFHAFLWTSTWRTRLAITWALQGEPPNRILIHTD
jgi:hypothetical protein